MPRSIAAWRRPASRRRAAEQRYRSSARAGWAGWRRRPTPQAASPRSRRCPTTRRSAAIRTTPAARSRSARPWPSSTTPAAPSMPAASVDAPTTVGFCMYIRREALREVGDLRCRTLRRRLRRGKRFLPARHRACGWRHRLACDTFVYHKGSVSFGDRASEAGGAGHDADPGTLSRAMQRDIARHVSLDAIAPFRFARDRGAVPAGRTCR